MYDGLAFTEIYVSLSVNKCKANLSLLFTECPLHPSRDDQRASSCATDQKQHAASGTCGEKTRCTLEENPWNPDLLRSIYGLQMTPSCVGTLIFPFFHNARAVSRSGSIKEPVEFGRALRTMAPQSRYGANESQLRWPPRRLASTLSPPGTLPAYKAPCPHSCNRSGGTKMLAPSGLNTGDLRCILFQ